MGQLLATLNLRKITDSNQSLYDSSFDIEHATPSTNELGTYNQLYTVLVEPTESLLKCLADYRPPSEDIRNAIANPTVENEDRAWNSVLVTMYMLRQFHDYSLELEQHIPKLLDILCRDETSNDLDRHPGLTKLFAETLDFVFEFDYLKIRSPSLQNDFSYYRRTLQKGRKTLMDTSSDGQPMDVTDDLVDRISLFIAPPTPMLKRVIDTTTAYVQSNHLVGHVGEWMAKLWASCYFTVTKKRNTAQPDLTMFCLKVMVISIILYDHIDPNGAYNKYSPINIKSSLKIIQGINPSATQDPSNSSNLISALRYNSKHLNDESTPKGIRNLIMTV
ncbi:hypothetical protein BDB01DRAFT_797168 [Pilobolus umbonatus]|nr:hypothetical protein BDB01DRAFT_797168 [Pilobolus umbonatus]